MNSHQTNNRSIATGALWMGLTIVSFTGTAVAAREMSGDIGVFQMMFMRSVVGLIVLTPLVLRHRAYSSHQLPLQIGRNLAHFGGQYGWTLGVVLLPLAEVFALEFTTPIWVALLAAPFLGEPMNRGRWIAVAGGFIGILVILRPGTQVVDPASFIVLGAALCFGMSTIMTKKLTATDSALTILFFMCLIQLPIGAFLSWPQWVTPDWANLPWIIVYGIGSLTAHLGMAKAFTHADATIMIPIDFLRVPAVAVVGMLLYNEPLVIWVVVGGAIIFGANYYCLRRETR